MEQNLPNQELLWRQYNLLVDIYKYYLDMTLRVNLFFYGITGAILTFYFANTNIDLIQYSLLLPIAMSLGFGGLFFYGSFLLNITRDDIFDLRDQLELDTAPDAMVLSLSLRVFGIIFLGVAIAMIIVLIRH